MAGYNHRYGKCLSGCSKWRVSALQKNFMQFFEILKKKQNNMIKILYIEVTFAPSKNGWFFDKKTVI